VFQTWKKAGLGLSSASNKHGSAPGTKTRAQTSVAPQRPAVDGLAGRRLVDGHRRSRQVRELDELGAVRRSADPDDGRVGLLELTAKGRRMAEDIRTVGIRHLDDALRDWSVTDVRALTSLLGRLVDDLVATPVPLASRRRTSR
jgi:DNA-binding MarR family transcriptional regulator